jgi:hypothetical protein
MRTRREFIMLLGSAAAWPISVRAEQTEPVRRVGVLMGNSDPVGRASAAAFVQRLEQLDRILKGAMPAELPVQFPSKFKLIVNLKTANAFGLKVPLHIQQLADEVIE